MITGSVEVKLVISLYTYLLLTNYNDNVPTYTNQNCSRRFNMLIASSVPCKKTKVAGGI